MTTGRRSSPDRGTGFDPVDERPPRLSIAAPPPAPPGNGAADGARDLPADDPRRLRSRPWLAFFDRMMRWELKRSFHAVRIARPGVPAVRADLPLVLYCNHPSWWDAALVPTLAAEAFPARRVFAPIDADALERYSFMRRVGFFGIKPDTHAGAVTFLRVGLALLTEADVLFGVTPEGRFTDPRTRPVLLRPGLAGLLARAPRVTVLPLAVEYVFWGERAPEALVRFGDPVEMGGVPRASADAIQQVLQQRLTEAMDALSHDAVSRDADRFVTVFGGRSGVNPIYDLWRRLQARLRGERFDPSHEDADAGRRPSSLPLQAAGAPGATDSRLPHPPATPDRSR